MFSIVFGIVHPRLFKDLKGSTCNFFDIGKDEVSTIIFKNLMKEVLDCKNHKNLDIVFEDFFKSRAIEKDSNQHFKNIYEVFTEYKKWYTGSKVTGVKMYLVKKEENKVVDIICRWKTFRESPGYIPKKRRSKKSFNV